MPTIEERALALCRAIPASDISPAYLVGDRIAPHS